MRFLRPLLPWCLVLAGCVIEPGLGLTPTAPAASARPGSQPPAASASARPTAGPAAAGERATADRPDDVEDFQTHVIYFLPSDVPDEQLDTNGAIAAMLADARQWMVGQTGGPYLRLDTYQGQPDVTFFRSRHDNASFGTSAGSIRDQVQQELEDAGFTGPQKSYCALFAGSNHQRADHSTTGLSSGPYSAVFFNQCNPCGDHPETRGMGHKTGLTYLHESFHGLGIVPDCAPHADGSHVDDDENDIMSASGVSMYLDRGHDDYFRANIPGCLDLADSPFLEPRPDHPVAVKDRPQQLSPGDNPRPVTPPDGGKLVITAMTAGDGPYDTVTVAFTVTNTLPGTVYGHVVVDGDRYVMAYRFDDTSTPQTIYASLPTSGDHAFSLGYGDERNGTEYHAHNFAISDGVITVKD